MYENREIRYPFTRQIMFAKVMEDPELCKEFIQRIFTKKQVKEVVVHNEGIVTTEATLIPGVYSKTVRLDVLFHDEAGWYNIEMQVAKEDDLPQRGRYYSSAIDIAHMKPGQPYGDLKNSFVIFICRFDYYGRNEAVYTFERFDKKLQLPYSDGSYIILLNTVCSDEKVPEELHSLFNYINNEQVEPDDWFVEKIHQEVLRYQSDEEVEQVATLEEEYMKKITKAERQGLAEGLEKGLAEGAATMQQRLNKLTTLLIESGRLDDLRKSAEDAAFQQHLLDELGL